MDTASVARAMLSQEARALRTRLDRLTSFAVRVPMVPAAAISNEAQDGIERFLEAGKRQLRADIERHQRWLHGPGRSASPEEMQHRFTMTRLGFNVILEQFEIFSAALTQRAEHGTGVWLAGLDAVALDALTLDGGYYEVPPVICYLDRGIGAAIRRARTRLPGGGPNPVAIIRVPRERMVGAGIGASLIHEVGHQGAALLELLPPLSRTLRTARVDSDLAPVWHLWERWGSEIVANLWAVATLGVGATLGLMNVVSLPRYFVFRTSPDDPHPIPYVRVKLSCAMGRALYPTGQWDDLAHLWEELYPSWRLPPDRRAELAAIERAIPTFLDILFGHRISVAGGQTLPEILPVAKRQPEQLRDHLDAWRASPELVESAPPSLVLAALGQARVDGGISPERESAALATLLDKWALQTAVETSANCSALRRRRAVAVA